MSVIAWVRSSWWDCSFIFRPFFLKACKEEVELLCWRGIVVCWWVFTLVNGDVLDAFPHTHWINVDAMFSDRFLVLMRDIIVDSVHGCITDNKYGYGGSCLGSHGRHLMVVRDTTHKPPEAQ